ncbi:alpha/beta hydrolase [Novosphingobium flavum]|uniref:alpha/beta fold hydrolase n=1 Tax=Novosphingobium flavum TaxID=1778672 RepID=UPI0031B5DB16
MTLLVLPGLMCDSRAFPGICENFAGAVVLDGFYGTARTIYEMASQVLGEVPGKLAVLGHSMGARVALELIRMAPERVARLALVDTGIHPVSVTEVTKRHALRDLGRAEGIERLVDAWLPPMIGRSHRADRALRAALYEMACSARQAGFERQIEALIARPDATTVLGGITCPTFVIVGSEDEWSPVAQHREIAERIDGAELRVVEGAGHMLPTEAPSLFHEAIREWLGWNPAAPADA